MAQKIQTLFIDDIDGGEAEGTVRFGLDGTEFEIDLNARHSVELHNALEVYVLHARKVGGPPGGIAAIAVVAPARSTRPGPVNGQGKTVTTSRNGAGSRPISWPSTRRQGEPERPVCCAAGHRHAARRTHLSTRGELQPCRLRPSRARPICKSRRLEELSPGARDRSTASSAVP